MLAHPDADLVKRMGTGDTGALAILLERYWASLVRYANGLVGSRDEAEDVALETFERLWERRDAWRVDDSVLPLLLRITRNTSLDSLRRRSTRERTAENLPQPPSQPTPSDTTEKDEIKALVTQALDCLPDRRREALNLARIHGLSRKEVAEVMGLAPQTVANHLNLAMDEVRRILAPYFCDSLHDYTADASDTLGRPKHRADVGIHSA
jgi:RNA polymerase sigma-70 factor (ECF subfamily)